MRKEILINCSNLRGGGGVQVATSFLYELSLLDSDDVKNLDILVSTAVWKNLSNLNFNHSVFQKFEIQNVYGFSKYFKNRNLFKGYELVFTVFGPNYHFVSGKDVVGFAQPWIIYPKNELYLKMSKIGKILTRLKSFTQKIFFHKSDRIIVEIDHVKNKLSATTCFKDKKIDVVLNTLSSIYFDKTQWSFLENFRINDHLALGIISRDYPHKNLEILPHVAEILKQDFDLKVMFFVTLNENEWASKNTFFKKYVKNVGALTTDQCPSFYKQLDGVIFPSLLECFSIAPLEAMFMEKPLFASDKKFVRDVCLDYANYFNPTDARDIAKTLATYFKSNFQNDPLIKDAKLHASTFSAATTRAARYLEIIKETNLENKKPERSNIYQFGLRRIGNKSFTK